VADATIIDGKAVATRLRKRIAAAAAQLREEHAITAGLAAVLVGDDPASQVYIRSKARACTAAGLASFEFRLPGDAAPATILDTVQKLNLDERVDGILVQLPLPRGIDPAAIIGAIDPAKDVDGFHPVNVGRLWSGNPGLIPCTPQGILLLLRAAEVPLTGAEAVVLGRSAIVGRPVAALLLSADCTVTIAHSKSRDLPGLCRRADILVASIGRPQMVTGDWLKPGAAIIDVGINRIATEAGSRLVGDVNFETARRVAGKITPVPGGVGPMTIACLLRNTVLAACRRRGLADPAGL
jgi:methylenetetrahydrofolate dehydrogenase (NADP+)/methenyltetrahydrofolate cyclohydrolase